jgi:hypothetical protein
MKPETRTVTELFDAEKCVELLGAAMARHTVIPHSDRPHGAHARGELDGAQL